MNKKLIVIVVVIILLLVGICYFVYTANSIKVGNTYFAIPDGFTTIDNDDYVNLTNGHDYVCIVKNSSYSNLNQSIKAYSNLKMTKENVSVSISQHNVGNHIIYKSTSNKDPNILHYWVENNGKVYEFFSWSKDSNSEYLVNSLSQNMKSFIF